MRKFVGGVLLAVLATLATPGVASAEQVAQGRTYGGTAFGVAGALPIIRRDFAVGQDYDLKLGGKTVGAAHYAYLTVRSFGPGQARWIWQTVFDGTLAELPLNAELSSSRFVRLSGNSNGTVTLYTDSQSGPTTVGYTNPSFETVVVRSYARWDDMFIGDSNTGFLYYQSAPNNPSGILLWGEPTALFRTSNRVCAILNPSYRFFWSQNAGQTCGGGVNT